VLGVAVVMVVDVDVDVDVDVGEGEDGRRSRESRSWTGGGRGFYGWFHLRLAHCCHYWGGAGSTGSALVRHPPPNLPALSPCSAAVAASTT
jgi:hypothetical protein